MDLVLHIGTEKTGTTLIQKTLYRNRELLRSRGVALSNVLGAPNNRLLPARFQSQLDDFHQRHNLDTVSARDAYFEEFDAQFFDDLAQMRLTGAKRLVISSEHLSSRLTNREDLARLRGFLAPHFSSISVLCYVREQAALNRSLYSTAILNGYDLSAEEFAGQISVSDVYYNYEKMLGLWTEAFGAEAVRVAIYDWRWFSGGDLLTDFFHRVVPALDPGRLNRRVWRKNLGVTTGQAALMRPINRAGLPDKLRRILVECVRYLPLADHVPDPDLRRRVYEEFDESNRAMARRFLGRDANPFAE